MSLRRLLLSQMSLRGALLMQDLGCGELGNAAVSYRELVNAAVSCGSHLSSQRPPAELTWYTHTQFINARRLNRKGNYHRSKYTRLC
ncbi:unnamed protein product [Penicillium nalgiovense]|nr:unnamed protein product [Penicillium nalgiovense]